MGMKIRLPGGSFVNVAKPSSRVNMRANYGVTPLGMVKAQEGEIPGNRGKVLDAVYNLSASEPAEIAQEANLPPEQVKRILRVLIKKGYVQQEQNVG